MRKILGFAAAAAALAALTPASAQERRDQRPAPRSPMAQQVLSGSDQPDVFLEVPNLSVDELIIEVDRLEAHIALDARLANLLKLTAGANVSVDKVKISLKGVQAQATLVVRLDNVRAIIERTLQTLDNNPQIVERLLTTVDNSVGTVGGVANSALGTVGEITGSLLRNGQVLDLARAGLTEISQSVNAAGQTLRRVRNNRGQLFEVVTDTANRVVSSRSLQQ